MKLRVGQRLPFRRRREQKTDYNSRLKLLKSGLPMLVVRRGNDNIHIQIVQWNKDGDKTLAEEISRNLRKVGWKGHCGNLPAAYLTGMLLGKKALKAGVNEAVLNLGLQLSTKGNALYAAAKGVRDAGVDVPVDEEILPDDERVSGKHIASYVKGAENIVKNFEEVKKKIESM